MHGPSSGEAWRRITASRGLVVAAVKPAREMLRASDGAGSHEPEEDRSPEAGGHKAKPGDDHAFADEVPQVRADHEQEHECDDDCSNRRISKVKECERDDWKERRQEWGDAVDERAQNRGELEGLLVFLTESREHRSLDGADVELLLDALRFVGTDRAAHRKGDCRADR